MSTIESSNPISESANAEIDRREAIKRVTALLSGLVFVGHGDLFTAVERAHARAATVRQTGTFTAQDVALLDEVADTILPDTKTPGAKAAHTGAFMALMVTDTYDEQQQATFRDGLQKLNAAGFMTKSPADRLAFLEQLDKDAKAYMDTRAQNASPHYFRQIKELTLLGYFTSEIGCTQAMRYRETPGRYDPCAPYTPGETSWAAHA
ncbi:MAG TPA: gluconate 2-dehydrogenase subunit 3 family protein [Gemmatimonadales bacterium]|nr:gluconate 2-dehydrogenase subunit 3 family protein [Gemmatimonadales bacterium]